MALLKAPLVLAALLGLGFRVSSIFSCRFTKNLSPDKINLSTLKGQGQLTNLELDEEVLQNVLELPTWLAITRVYCNKASIRVSRAAVPASPGAADTFSWQLLCHLGISDEESQCDSIHTSQTLCLRCAWVQQSHQRPP